MVAFLPQHLIIPGLSAIEQATNYAKELIHVIKNRVPKTPFTIGESLLQAVDKLAKLFNTMQPATKNTTVVPSKVTTIALTRVPVTVPPPRVPEEVTPPRVMIPRKPMITQEVPIEYNRQRYTVEHNNQHQLKHRYYTIITQLSQEINQVYIAAKAATRHQHFLINIYEQVKTTPQVIDNCLKENAFRLPKTMTQHDYLTNMSHAIIDDDTGKELNYFQLSKHTKHQQICKQSFTNELGRLAQG